jgi:putative methionine-R-sulfoxide reductase with GAF domain
MTTEPIFATLNNKQTSIDWQQLLNDTLAAFDCSTGTLHFLNKQTNLLELQAQTGIPAFLLPKMTTIPIGKGMAGIAAERKEAVEMCNLQTDESGVARPSAKDTKVEGSLAAPLLLDGELFGVIGIAKPIPYDFTPDEINELMKIGKEISHRIKG